MITQSLPPAADLHTLLLYNPATGALRRRWMLREITGGKRLGDGIQVAVCGRVLFAHRIIWKMVTGEDPPDMIDHVNGDSYDNRWCNLRLATNQQNQANRGATANSRSGIKGVMRHGLQWRAQIYFNGEQIRLGVFGTSEQAREAYMTRAVVLFGQFASQGV